MVGVIGVLYQFIQYMLNIRVFPIEGKILLGNSIQHTGLKLAEMGLGYMVGIISQRNGLNSLI